MKKTNNEETQKIINDIYKKSIFRLYMPFIFASIIYLITIYYNGSIENLNKEIIDNRINEGIVDNFINFIYAFILISLEFIAKGAKYFNSILLFILLSKDLFKFVLFPNKYNQSIRNKIHSSLSFTGSLILAYLLNYHLLYF